MPVDKRRKDWNWNVCSDDGVMQQWESRMLAVLMDIRDELKAANRVWGCSNFTRIPSILDTIATDSRRRNRLAQQKAIRKRQLTLARKAAAR